MLDARFSHLYFCQSLNRLQLSFSTIAELLVTSVAGGQTDRTDDSVV